MAEINNRRSPGGYGPGPGVDIHGVPVIDPTANVLETIKMAVQRQDDLRIQESSHVREILAIRAEFGEIIQGIRSDFDGQFRALEANRINAIRAVDAQAITRAGEVAAVQATTLAAQVSAAAEAMRTQIANTQAQGEANLRTALEPLQVAITDLRRIQYEQQGQRVAQGETKDTSKWLIGIVVGIVGAIFTGIIVGVVVYALTKPAPSAIPRLRFQTFKIEALR